MRLVLATAGALCALVALLPPTAGAAPGVRFGIQDDAWLEFGPGRLGDRVARIDRLGLKVVRVTLHWHRIEARQGEHDWRRADRLLRALHRQGLDPVVTLWGTPAWAGSGAPNAVPARGEDFEAFARAAASRYRFVRHWTMWNEPNKIAWLRPVSPRLYVSRILNPGYAGIKAASRAARVAGGVTAPRGGKGGMAPVDFIRGMDRARARLDAYAHHPYPAYPGDTPFSGGCGHCRTITMSTLERLVREVGRAFPRARIWLTEFGYQSTPDPFGVSPELQARFVAEAARRVYAAPRVEMLIHYLYRDEPDLGRWQSGLETVDGRAKPALSATMLPLAQLSRTGTRTRVWGQIRPGDGPRRYVVQIHAGGRWVAASGARSTSARGYLTAAVRAPRGAKLRLWYPARRLAGATLVVR